MNRRPSNAHRPGVSRAGGTGMRFGMFAVCVSADPDPLVNEGPPTFALYCRLIGFADAGSRNTDRGHPYRSVLASSLSCSKQTVDRATNRLELDIGLISVERRKLPGETEENDANRYTLHDSWLINGFPAPAGTPPQLVARYGHTVGGFDVDEWLSEHAPDFDLSAWQADYKERLAGQLAKEAEQRRKERARRKPPKGQPADQQEQDTEGGGVKNDATPQDQESGGGSVKFDATGGVIFDATGGVRNDALLLEPLVPEPFFEMSTSGDGRRPSTGGFASAGARSGAGDGDQLQEGGSAAVTEGSAEVKTDGPEPARETPRKRAAAPATKTREPQPVAGESEVFALLDSLGVLTSPANRIPPLRRAVREFLGAQVDARDTAFRLYPRTVEHAVTRINAGWTRAHTDRTAPGYLGCKRCTDIGCTGPQDSCERIRKPQAYLAELLKAQDCDRPDCERGVMLGTREACALCVARAQAVAEGLAATTWLVEDAARQIEARAKADAERAAVAAEAEQRARAAAEAEARQAAEAEETLRIREQLAADHPELVCPAEVPAPRDAEAFVRAAGRGRTATEEQRVRSQLVAQGLVGTALDTEVRRRMATWKADRRREAAAADLAARAAHSVGAWPTADRHQPAEAPF